MKKGFTLIEMIGVIVVISLMALIIIPPVTRSLKEGVQKADEQTKESIIAAAKNYVSDNKPVETECKTVSDLQEAGYLDDNIKLPSDNTKDLGGVRITVTTPNSGRTKYKYSYQYVENCN